MGHKTKKKRGGSWRDYGLVIRKSNVPWLWVIAALTIRLLYNQILLWLPDTTTSLMRGNLTNDALWGAIRFYAAFGITACVSTLVESQACVLSVRRARERLWTKMMRVKVSFYDQNDPSFLMSAVTTDLNSGFKDSIRILFTLLPELYYVGGALIRISNYHWMLVMGIVLILPFKYI